VVLLFEVFATLAHINRAVGTCGKGGRSPPPQILADQLTLYQSGGQYYAYVLLFVPPLDFQTFPTALNSEREQEANSSSEGRQ
jgi:hypothetical protein